MHRSLGIVLALVAGSCSREGARSDSTAAASGFADGIPTPLHVTERGVGPLRAGMTLAELRQAFPRVVFRGGEDSTGCAYPTIEGLPDGVVAMIDSGFVVRVDVTKGDMATSEGIRIGDDSAEVRAAYGSRMTVSPHKYTDGRYLTVAPDGDANHRIVFETNDAGVVLRYRAGQLPQVAWVEGCS
jgi:hypothetical protein